MRARVPRWRWAVAVGSCCSLIGGTLAISFRYEGIAALGAVVAWCAMSATVTQAALRLGVMIWPADNDEE